MRKILLAGGAGYVGTSLTRELLNRNYDVTIVDLLWFKTDLPKGVVVWNKNIMDMNVEELNGFDAVVFLAGLSNDPMANFNPSMNFVENAAVPSYLAYISKMAGVPRFVYASSCSVYGYTDNNLMDETDSVFPRYPYGVSKLEAEAAIMNMGDENFRPISLRKGTIGGYSTRMRYDLVVNTMTKTALTEGKIIVNNPSLWRPLLDLRDAVTAYVRSIEANLNISGVYNISYDNYTMGRLADDIKEELENNGHSVVTDVRNVQDVRNYKVQNKKAKIELDFVAKYSPQETVRHLLQNIDLKNYDFNNDKYYNIKVFKKMF